MIHCAIPFSAVTFSCLFVQDSIRAAAERDVICIDLVLNIFRGTGRIDAGSGVYSVCWLQLGPFLPDFLIDHGCVLAVSACLEPVTEPFASVVAAKAEAKV